MSDGRPDEAVSRFVEQFASTFVDSGMARMPSRIFAALLVSESGRLTAAELAKRLQASPAAVSGGVRYLLNVNLVRREREPGTRRDVIVFDEDWYQMTVSTSPLLSRGPAQLREGMQILGESPASERMGETLAFLEFIDGERRGMLDRWRQHRAKLREGRKET